MTGPLTATASHWAQIGEVTFVPGMRLIFWLHRRLGRWAAEYLSSIRRWRRSHLGQPDRLHRLQRCDPWPSALHRRRLHDADGPRP